MALCIHLYVCFRSCCKRLESWDQPISCHTPDTTATFPFPAYPSLPLCMYVVKPTNRAFFRRIDTGSTCKHIGYDEFEPSSWPSSCAPNKEDWIDVDRWMCGMDGAYPEVQ